MRQARPLILVLLTMGCANVNEAQTDIDKLMAQSQRQIQEQIKTVYTTLNQPGVDPYGHVEALPELRKLKSEAADKGELVKQLAIFAATPTDDEQLPLMANMVLHLLDLPPSVVIPVLAPYLDADNRNLRSFVRDWFQGHDNAAAPGPGLPPLQPVNYEDYRDYVRSRLNQEIPDEFVQYIYEREPGRALLAFYYAAGLRRKDPDILLAEHIVSNAIWLKDNRFTERFQTALPEAADQLTKLARRSVWWIRLYVAWIMRQHPELRDPVIVQQLVDDSHSLVSETAKAIRQ